MISPIQSFDIGAIQGGMQAGMQRGAVNSPFTPLGQALKGTLDKYQSTLAAQQAQQNALGLKQAEYGMVNGRKTALSEAAKAQLNKLRQMSGVDPESNITYEQGARYMDDPAGGGRRLISNAVADDTAGTADWGSWAYAPQENVIQDMTNSKLGATLGRGPRVTWPLGQRPQSPIPGVSAPTQDMQNTSAMTAKDQALLDLIGKL